MNLQVFENEVFGKVRVIEKNNEPWFVGKDVAEMLGYADTFGALKKHVKSIHKQNCQNDSFESNRGLTIIDEAGLYSLVLRSKLPAAEIFQEWVVAEVIPAVRNHGGYLTPEKTEELLNNPDLIIQLATNLKEERAARSEIEQQLAAAQPKVIFADAVSVSDSTILIGDMAKIIKQNGHSIGQKRMFQWLRNNGFLIKRFGADYNSPTQRSMELGLFKIKETAITHSDGHVTISKTVKVTGKGQQYFINKFAALLEGGAEE